MILIFTCRIQFLPLEPGQLLIMQYAQSQHWDLDPPTLAQLMARYATTDPILFSATADKRKGLSLIAPPAAKRKRTVKKVLIEVKFPLS
jgi:hypothetical protein